MKSAGPAIVVSAILLSPILYVLGVGPAAWLHERGILSRQIEIVYAPIDIAISVKALRLPLEAYIRLWRPVRVATFTPAVPLTLPAPVASPPLQAAPPQPGP